MITIASDPVLDAPFPSADEIQGILSERIDDQKQSVGIVVGLIGPEGRRIVGHGRTAVDDPRPVNGDTIYEIGSVTKGFTALILADMAHRGEVGLDDPVAQYLPEDVPSPSRNGIPITLRDLATHMSGLPRDPDNLAPTEDNNPFAEYTVSRLHEFIADCSLQRDPGEQFEYSNVGMGLLGHALALKAGTDFETLVRSRILAPLGMNSTSINLSPKLKSNLAVGHNYALDKVSNWDLAAIAGAGGLLSSAQDMLNYIEAALGYRSSPLAPSFTAMLAERRQINLPNIEIALAWGVEKSGDDEMVGHSGGTGGYGSFVGFLLKAKRGVVVLSNMSTSAGVGDIGKHLLSPEFELAPPPKKREVVDVDPSLYDRYVGRYRLAPRFVVSVTREDDRLFSQATDQVKFEIFPEGERDFFLRVVDAQITFDVNESGRAVKMTLFQNGQVVPGPRIDEDGDEAAVTAP